MSAAAPSSPAVVRSSSTSRRSVDRPHRSQSTASRPAGHAHRTHPPQSGLNNVARRDYEQSNVAQEQPSRRSEDPARPDPSRRGHSRYASDASTTSAMPINGVAADGRSGPVPANTKRRTTITAPSTGTWALGKTIGAGSMGKVKLAKHSETGEQVRACRQAPPEAIILTCCRSRSKSSLAFLRISIRAPPTANEPTIPRRCGLPERPPSSACSTIHTFAG